MAYDAFWIEECTCLLPTNHGPGFQKGSDALPSPGLNPLEGPTMCSCGKVGLEGRSRLLALKGGRGAC